MAIAATIHAYNQSLDNSVTTAILQGVGIAIAILAYFIPAVIGSERRARFQILATNALLGWTVIGWIVVLIWSLGKDKE